mmetsp:Transcript_5064/g.12939  ORF Transcript_5064/g.12939 Transcript_5064/m.12939 type:complete len:207 (-) Transcript_5064:163-783(-)
MEECMGREGHRVPDSHGRGMNTSSGPQMGMLSHVFQSMGFLTHGIKFTANFCPFHISSVHSSQQLPGCYGQFDGLSCTLTGNKSSNHLKGSTGSARSFAFVESFGLLGIEYALNGLSDRPVVEFHEQQLPLVGVTSRSGPSGNRDRFVEILRTFVGHHFLDADAMTAVEVGFDRRRSPVQHNATCATLGGKVLCEFVGRHASVLRF